VSATNSEEDYAKTKKREYLALARAHERQAYSLSDPQQAFYHIREAITNYKNALSLETDRLGKTDIDLKIERLEDQMRVVNNDLNQPSI
jgi:hypothetical protein